MLHALTIALSAFLLFNLQPMVAKIILPLFGGGSSIWLISLIFFQAVLLGGYTWVHYIALKRGHKQQVVSFFLIIIVALLFTPLQIGSIRCALPPAENIFLILLTSVGLPYFLLTCTSPLVQYLIGVDLSSRYRNPYILYAVSNIGSLAGLLSYPLLIEPNIGNKQQMEVWSALFWVFAFLLSLCLLTYMRAYKRKAPLLTEKYLQKHPLNPKTIPNIQKAKWFFSTFIPSWALMVFTHYMTMDIVNLPLLWVLPLSLYLLSFIICFLWSQLSNPSYIRTLIVLLPVTMTSIAVWSGIHIDFLFKLVLSLVCLFAICMFFHGNLEHDKPSPQWLTLFYFYLSLGGLSGGIFVGILAPLVFKSVVEYDLLLCVVLYLIISPYLIQVRTKIRIIFQIFFALLVIGVYILQENIFIPPYIYKARSFYGAFKVKEWPAIPNRQVAHRLLKMGTTTHGGQAMDAKGHLFPIAYYHEKTAAWVRVYLLYMATRVRHSIFMKLIRPWLILPGQSLIICVLARRISVFLLAMPVFCFVRCRSDHTTCLFWTLFPVAPFRRICSPWKRWKSLAVSLKKTDCSCIISPTDILICCRFCNATLRNWACRLKFTRIRRIKWC